MSEISREDLAKITKVALEKTTPRMCCNCAKWEKAKEYCTCRKKMTKSITFCPDHEFEVEHLINAANEIVDKHILQCEKAENVMAMTIILSSTLSSIVLDLERRLKALKENERDAKIVKLLRKDISVADEMKRAFDVISKKLKEIDSQFRFYIQPNIDNYAYIGGQFDGQRYDTMFYNSLDFEELLFMFVKKCINNEANYNRVFGLLDELQNDSHYALEEKDIKKKKTSW